MPARRLLRTAAALAGCPLAALAWTGCGPDPLPPEPFGTVTLQEGGGVDGRDNLLTVEPDGTALLLGTEPAAGRLSAERMNRIEELVTGADFRTEAATRAPESDRCSDQVSYVVAMGSLSMGRSVTCRAPLDRTPVFDELVTLLAIEEPLPAGEPALQATGIAFDRGDAADTGERTGTLTLSPAGDVRVEIEGAEPYDETLAEEDRDTVRLVQARLVERGPVPVAECESSAGAQVVTLAGTDHELNPCQPVREDRELHALWRVLSAAAELE